jgi:hypothetical protein
MDTPISLTTLQVNIINTSLERSLSIAELLVDCGPMEKLLSQGSLTAVFSIMEEELGKLVR